MARKVNSDRVVDRYCDVAMARSKGFLPCNESSCKSCIACVEVLNNGERRHFFNEERKGKK